jgi:hypothetical protein
VEEAASRLCGQPDESETKEVVAQWRRRHRGGGGGVAALRTA